MNMIRQHDPRHRRHGGIGLELEGAGEAWQRGHRHRSQCGEACQVQKETPGLKTFRSDVSEVKEIEALHAAALARLPELNVIVNNAGTMRTINLHKEASLEELTREIEINPDGPIRMVTKFLPVPEEEAARGDRQRLVGPGVRAAADCADLLLNQAALHSYTLSLRAAQNTNVKVFEIAPPATETEVLSGRRSPRI